MPLVCHQSHNGPHVLETRQKGNMLLFRIALEQFLCIIFTCGPRDRMLFHVAFVHGDHSGEEVRVGLVETACVALSQSCFCVLSELWISMSEKSL